MADKLDAGAELSLDLVVPGTVTAVDVFGAEGSLLLPAGRVLTDAVLASLRQCGVRTLRIKPPEDGDAATEHREQRLRHLFRHSSGDPAAGELLAMLREFGGRSDA